MALQLLLNEEHLSSPCTAEVSGPKPHSHLSPELKGEETETWMCRAVSSSSRDDRQVRAPGDQWRTGGTEPDLPMVVAAGRHLLCLLCFEDPR